MGKAINYLKKIALIVLTKLKLGVYINGTQIRQGHKTIIYPMVKLYLQKNTHFSIGNAVIRKGLVRATKEGSILIEDGVYLTSSDIEANGGAIYIREGTYINKNAQIVSLGEVKIGRDCAIGPNLTIYDHDHIFTRNGKNDWTKSKVGSVIIGDNVWIGANVTILRGTKVGNNCIIGAGSVVKGTIPSGKMIIPKSCEILDIK